jgi:cell fate (sporulation/competence/biofilm development) regulator YmcA (YheA/YmcA/DUF963 family)
MIHNGTSLADNFETDRIRKNQKNILKVITNTEQVPDYQSSEKQSAYSVRII